MKRAKNGRWKNGQTETKKVLDDLNMPKLEKIFTTVCHRVALL